MKKQVQLALTSVAIGVASLVVVTQGATAQTVSFAKPAKGINTWMARAMDECNAATVTVLTPNSPGAGCPQSNGTSTDNSLGMQFLRLQVNQKGRIHLYGKGFLLGDELHVKFTLRITQKNVSTSGGLATVTFPDLTNVECPQFPDAFNARPNGTITGSTDLTACLSPNSGLTAAGSNIEIIDVSVINALTGNPVAVPGIIR